MYYKSIGGTRNGNQSCPQEAGSDLQGGCRRVGDQSAHTGSVGAGAQGAKGCGASVPQANPQSRPVGGQASLTLHGIPGATRPAAYQAATRPPQGETSTRRYPTPAETKAAREYSELAYQEQRRRQQAFLAEKYPSTAPAAPKAKAPVPSAPTPGAPSPVIAATLTRASDFPLLLLLRQPFFEAFARVAEREVRPVEELVVEVLSNYARFLQERDFADAFGDELPAPPLTQAMRLAAAAEDARESGIGLHPARENVGSVTIGV